MKNIMYYYYSMSDSTCEPISKGKFDDEESAIEYWSQLKRMQIDDFLSIYQVTEFYES
jgi:hypothetical protein